MLRGLRQARTGFAQVLAAMALVALAVRALVPGGYMLAASNDSSFVSIVLCSGHEAVLDVSTGQLVDTSQPLGNGDNSSGDSDAPCVFAAAAHLAPPEMAPEVAAPLLAIRAEPIRAPDIAPGRGLAAPPPWATGQPRTV